VVAEPRDDAPEPADDRAALIDDEERLRAERPPHHDRER
jgi:hypothetical protein